MTVSKEFKSLGLSPEILSNLVSLGYLEMTPIQERGLPVVLGKRDLIAQANTGSGKTAAFALGILSKIDLNNNQPQALVLCPTRELAEQVSEEIRRLARFTNKIKVLTLAGGTEEQHKTKSLEHGAHIIVGTPGRIRKLLEKKVLRALSINMLVLDEADRLLELGFLDDINKIAASTPLNRQTMLFSATFPHGIKSLSASIQEDPAQVTIDSQHQQSTVKQLFFKVESEEKKFEALLAILGHFTPESAIIFCKSRVVCNKLTKLLKRNKIDALELHSDLEQKDRTLVLTKFANKSCRILVATDLASRGLDILDVGAVVNHDLPSDHELYIHRIGRTGRIGKEGLALNLYLEKEGQVLTNIGEYIKMKPHVWELARLKRSKSFTLKPSMATMYISAGKKDNLRPGDILGALTKEAGLAAADVGTIRILDVNSYVAISTTQIDRAVKSLTANKIKGRKFKVGKA